MSGHELDTTQQSFPAYAELTQTQGWSRPASPVRADTNEVAEAVEVSQRSRYTEGPVLGTGGMGKVLLARDARIGRDVAVKVLHPDRELDPDDRARFLREAQVQGQLEHPSIVPVYDIERRSDGTTFFTMRRVHGRTLAAIIDDLRKGTPAAKLRYTQRELLTAFSTVCLTVDYAHSRGVVHRDLKPANIMLGDFGEVYVLDWGLARLVDEKGATLEEPHTRLSLPGTFLGTPMYVAPEQMADPDVAPTADVFSLGLILFEILTLERARDPNALFAPVDARPSVRAPYRNVAPELEAVCVKATEGDPTERYPTARALQEAVNRFLEGDREAALRAQRASEHVKAAREALGRATETGADDEKERGTAITELGRAVALDPSNSEYFEMLARLMSTLPTRVPDEVLAKTERENQAVLHHGGKHSAIAMLSWWLFLPVMYWIGFRNVWQAVLIAVPALMATVIGLVMMKQKRIGRPIQYASIACMCVAGMALSRIYGPFLLVPSVVSTYALVLQAHPYRDLRIAGAVIASIAICVPAVLEWLGALPASYVFADGTWTIVPQLVELPKVGTNVFLLIAHVAMIVIPCLFIARLRQELDRAQMRLAVQAWHFKHLGTRLIGRPAAG